MKKFLKKYLPSIFILIKKINNGFKINNRFKEIKKIYKSNWMDSRCDNKTVGYRIILIEHGLEKGMTNKNPRYFGIEKIHSLIECLKLYEKNNWRKDFAYNLGVSILFEYCKFYEKNNWLNREEYLFVKNYLVDKKQLIKSGVVQINKESFIDDSKIDYDKFLSSRHSFREFSNRKISTDDIKKAVSMAIKTPTACNRQMCKIYYISNETVKNNIIKFSHGLTNFNNDTVNLIIVTFDISSLCNEGEINQGMFNAGLVSMNLVNSLHSLGVGSCFLEYSNSLCEENSMKELLKIPSCEKIAIVIAAGYYPEESIIPCSTRKPIDEIYREI